ncbi:hypothetical protein ACFLZ2_02900 [Candidatus Margulisiibacteriota bacterium]
MHQKVVYLKIILFLLVLLSFCASAEEIPVRIKADDLKYDETAGIVTAHGSVKVYFKGMELHSDSAHIDLNANIATLEGNVEILKEDYFATSKLVTHDISSEVTVVFGVRSVFKTPEIQGDLYVSARRIDDYGSRQTGEESSATSCDYEDPHYHVRSAHFDYYPDELLIGLSNTFYVGDLPLLWTPVYVFDLRKKRSPYNYVYGENQVEGKFLRTSFDYFINRQNYGLLYVDSTEKKGPGYGIGHDYILNENSSGLLYLYWINEKDTGLDDSKVRLDHNIKLDEYSKLALSYHNDNIYRVPAGRFDETGAGTSYSYDDGKKRLGINLNFLDNRYTSSHTDSFGLDYSFDGTRTTYHHDTSRSLRSPKWENMHEKFSHEQFLFSPNARMSFNLNYYKNATDEGVVADEKMEPWLDITYKGDSYSLKMTQNMYLDLDGSKYSADNNYEYLERLPEITIAFNPVMIGGFSLGFSSILARYHEAKLPSLGGIRHMTANKYSFGGNLSRSDNVGFGTMFSQSYGLTQHLYEPGDARYQYTVGLGVSTSLWGFFKNNINYSKGLSEGNSPFYFDNAGSTYDNIGEKLSLYYLDKVNFTLDTGYNFYTRQWSDIITNLLVTPNRMIRMNVNTGYSIERKLYRNLDASMTFIPFEGLTNTGGLTYNPNTGELLAANSLVDLVWGETWQEQFRFRMGHTYDFATRQYLLREVAFVKNLHCWEMTASYSDYAKEFRVGFTLRAFPNMPIGFAAGSRGSYFDGFWKNLNFY